MILRKGGRKKCAPNLKFSIHTKGRLDRWFSQCTPRGAHISQLAIQLNNECEGRIGRALASPFFFFIWEVRAVSGGDPDHRCRDSLVSGTRDGVALLFITRRWRTAIRCQAAAVKFPNRLEKRYRVCKTYPVIPANMPFHPSGWLISQHI